jgi:hypothetical protein
MHRHDLTVLAAVFAGTCASAAQSSDIGHELAGQVDVATYQYSLDELLGAHRMICE